MKYEKARTPFTNVKLKTEFNLRCCKTVASLSCSYCKTVVTHLLHIKY